MNDYENYKLDRLNKIKTNKVISTFINRNHFNDEFIKNNFHTFDNCLKSLEICEKCNGLNSCSQIRKGELVGLTFDGFLSNNMVICKKQLVHDDEYILSDRFVYSDIPEIYGNVNLNNIICDNDSLANLFVLVNKIADFKTNKGFYIYGDLGVGKTYMCIALANSLVLKNKRVSFIKINDFVTKMGELIRDDAYEFDTILNSVKKSDYLIIDDIGSELVSEFSRDRLLFNILDYRMENKLCSIFTSNFDKKALFNHFNNGNETNAKRIFERIDVLTIDHLLTGNNKRRS